ncbi:hypothetical protein CPB85DRAFT_910100 [Mucidula mucida]|nr:hypothetical protein CPB85DRAFT_910100 [Mucidula mucida]
MENQSLSSMHRTRGIHTAHPHPLLASSKMARLQFLLMLRPRLFNAQYGEEENRRCFNSHVLLLYGMTHSPSKIWRAWTWRITYLSPRSSLTLHCPSYSTSTPSPNVTPTMYRSSFTPSTATAPFQIMRATNSSQERGAGTSARSRKGARIVLDMSVHTAPSISQPQVPGKGGV